MNWLYWMKSTSIKSKMHLYIGISVALIMVISFSFYIFTLRSNTRENATKMAEELVKGYSNEMVGITNQAYGFSESLASSIVYMFNQQLTNRSELIKEQLTNSAKNNTNFKCIWVSLEHSAITPGYTKSSGRRSFLTVPSTNIPYMEMDKDMESYDAKGHYYIVKNSGKPDIKEPYFYNYYNNSDKEELITTVAYPIKHDAQTVGVAGVDIPMSDFQKLVDEINIYPGTQAYLVSQNGFIACHTDKKMVGKNFSQLFGDDNKLDLPKILSDANPTKLYNAINDEDYFTVFVPLTVGSHTKWMLGVSIPTSEIFAESRKSVLIAIFVCLLGLLVMTFVTNYIAKLVTKPLHDLTASIRKLSKGEVSDKEKLEIKTGDEMEEIANSLNVLVDGLNKTAQFAQEIGNGNLKADHQLLSEKDTLGISLREMQSSLVKANEKELDRKKEEEKTMWANQCYALFSELLRQNNDNIKELSHSIVSNLVKYLDINQGGMFVLTDADKSSEQQLEMTACFAYNRRKMVERTFEVGEGLVGRCFVEGETIYLLEIPDNYISITSGLGDTTPKCLLLVPLKINNEINGVLELASLTPIDDYKVKFVEKIAESIASTIASVRINMHTAELLSQTRQQAEEMAAQEEEMRQNLEELQSTQEEMARVQEEQKHIQETLHFEKALFNNFLETVPEAVYFKDEQSRLIRISKSLLKVHGKQNENEILGKTDFDLFGVDEHSQKAYNDEQNIIRSGQPIFNLIEKEQHKDGRTTWVITNKMPLRDTNGSIIGTFGVSKDFSDVMELQLSQNLFNSMLDTSSELIYFKDVDRRIIKANKTKYLIHGFTSEAEIIGKTDEQLLGSKFVASWAEEELEILQTGVAVVDKLEQIEGKDGGLIWTSTSKFPIKKDDKVEGLYILVKDVTAVKELEDREQKQASGEKVDLN